VDAFNMTLQRSAERHGKRLSSSSLITVKLVSVNGNVVRRAASGGREPLDLPLASAPRKNRRMPSAHRS